MTLTAESKLGPYEVMAPLGAGGMGEVYRARDPRLGRDVAIKVLPEELADEPDRLLRFEREAKAAGALNHPNVLVLHDIGRHENRPYVVYELLEGETLGERMRAGRLSPHETLTWAVQVAQGLAAAHAKGIVHRDLKPENLFLTRDGVLKILDFGLAKVVQPELEEGAEIDRESETRTREALTAEGAVLGTVGYMSPEQVKGERADHRADIFSLGVVLYEMLSGRRPFQGGSVPETLAAILKEDPPGLPEGEISPPIAEVVGRCLEKAPHARFQSAHDLALALEVLAASVAESGPAVTGIDSTGATSRWSRRLLPLGAGLVVLAGLALAVRPFMAPTGPPRLANLTKLTTDGVPKRTVSTDGRRVYYTSMGGPGAQGRPGLHLYQMPADGGQAVEIDPWPGEQTTIHWAAVSPADTTQLVMGRHAGQGDPGGGFFPSLPVWGLTLPAATPRRLGELSATGAAWSPDGERLALGIGDPIRAGENGSEVHVADKGGESSRPILTADQFAFVFDWSGDDRIAHYHAFLEPGKGWRSELWEMKADGSERRRLLPEWPESYFFDAHWTPDARYLLFTSSSELGRGPMWALEMGATEAVPLGTDGLHCGAFDLDPEGRRLFASCLEKRSELFAYRPEIGEWAPHDFPPDPSGYQPVWSRDGEWVAWVRFPEGTLWRSRPDGTRKLRLTEPSERFDGTMPQWSPDGEHLCFTQMTKMGVGLRTFVVSRDGQGLRPVTAEEYRQDRATWAPDGRVVVSDIWYQSAHARESPLRIVDLETGEEEDLPGTENLAGVSSSPDGRFMVAHEWGADGVLQVHLLNWETREWRPLPGFHGGLLQWSADSEFVYAARGEEDVYRYHLATGQTEAVADARKLRTQSFYWVVDPDGRILAHRTLATHDLFAWDLEY